MQTSAVPPPDPNAGLTPSEIVLLYGNHFASSQKNRQITAAVALALAGIGLALLTVFSAKSVWAAWASTSWPTTQGRITAAQVAQEGDLFEPVISYTYHAGGAEYTGTQIYFGSQGTRSSNESGARELVDAYPPGKQVTVAYDPQDPTSAVLQPGVHINTVLPLAIALVFLILLFFLFKAYVPTLSKS